AFSEKDAQYFKNACILEGFYATMSDIKRTQKKNPGLQEQSGLFGTLLSSPIKKGNMKIIVVKIDN
ncbi:6919_t:CDS:2, partial [Paraglomus brasilianum]